MKFAHSRKQMPEEKLTRTIPILSSDADRYQHLRMSALFRFLQEASILDTELAGITREKTLDKGLLWVIARIHLQLSRPLFYDETITISTWPDETMHMLFPRQYEICDQNGTVIGGGAAIWLLINASSRTIVFPAKYGIVIPARTQREEIEIPSTLPSFDGQKELFSRIAQYSEIDLNGHVNNTKYFDWIDDCFAEEWHRDHFFSEIQMHYDKEISCNDAVTIEKIHGKDAYLIHGMVDQKAAFHACLKESETEQK